MFKLEWDDTAELVFFFHFGNDVISKTLDFLLFQDDVGSAIISFSLSRSYVGLTGFSYSFFCKWCHFQELCFRCFFKFMSARQALVIFHFENTLGLKSISFSYSNRNLNSSIIFGLFVHHVGLRTLVILWSEASGVNLIVTLFLLIA